MSNIKDIRAHEPDLSHFSNFSLHFCLKNSSSTFSHVSVNANLISNGKFLFSIKIFKKLSFKKSEHPSPPCPSKIPKYDIFGHVFIFDDAGFLI